MENEHFNSEGGLIIRDKETDLEQFLQIKQLGKSGVEKGTACDIKFDLINCHVESSTVYPIC